MLFFQLALLAGYAYAACIARMLTLRKQIATHVGLLGLACLMLPITPSGWWRPVDGELPILRILVLLAACVGGPYFLLSATSPLLQLWFARTCPNKSPYRLYALSNIGSLGALLAYPLLVEPWLSTPNQGSLWSLGFVLFWVSLLGLGWMIWKLPGRGNVKAASDSGQASEQFKFASRTDRCYWLFLPALATMMLLAVTNFLTQDVAVVPFLWIAPLSLYLISLIICFDGDRWYNSGLYSGLAMLAIWIACDLMFLDYIAKYGDSLGDYNSFWNRLRYDLRVAIGVYLTLFFLLSMVCHGEVVKRRPCEGQLTEFYLWIAAGGALGGFIVAIVCPIVFTTFLELKLGLLCGFLLCTYIFVSYGKRTWFPYLGTPTLWAGALLLVTLNGLVAAAQWLSLDTSATWYGRNFYGTLTIRDFELRNGRGMYHGATIHGYQMLDPEKQSIPTSYYEPSSGIGRAIRSQRRGQPLHIGVVGLGAGTLAAYGQAEDRIRFYEINPMVVELAHRQFAFLKNCTAKIDVVPGDARVALEREGRQDFDVLVLDAFSGDAIPVHLLTVEALKLYRSHIKDDGIVAIHVSNRYLDLEVVVGRLAQELGLAKVMMSTEETEFLEKSPADWILLANHTSTLESEEIRALSRPVYVAPYTSLWTDQSNNLFQVLRLRF